MNGIEVESVIFSHHFARHTDSSAPGRMRSKMTMLQPDASLVAKGMAKMEEVVSRMRS